MSLSSDFNLFKPRNVAEDVKAARGIGFSVLVVKGGSFSFMVSSGFSNLLETISKFFGSFSNSVVLVSILGRCLGRTLDVFSFATGANLLTCFEVCPESALVSNGGNNRGRSLTKNCLSLSVSNLSLSRR